MMTIRALAIVAAGMFAAASVFAGEDHACCAKGGEKMANKAECGMSFATLNLTKEQETKMKAAAEDCKKGGCSEESMAAMNQKAKEILNEKQFASWKEKGCGHDKADEAKRS